MWESPKSWNYRKTREPRDCLCFRVFWGDFGREGFVKCIQDVLLDQTGISATVLLPQSVSSPSASKILRGRHPTWGSNAPSEARLTPPPCLPEIPPSCLRNPPFGFMRPNRGVATFQPHPSIRESHTSILLTCFVDMRSNLELTDSDHSGHNDCDFFFTSVT